MHEGMKGVGPGDACPERWSPSGRVPDGNIKAAVGSRGHAPTATAATSARRRGRGTPTTHHLRPKDTPRRVADRLAATATSRRPRNAKKRPEPPLRRPWRRRRTRTTTRTRRATTGPGVRFASSAARRRKGAPGAWQTYSQTLVAASLAAILPRAELSRHRLMFIAQAFAGHAEDHWINVVTSRAGGAFAEVSFLAATPRGHALHAVPTRPELLRPYAPSRLLGTRRLHAVGAPLLHPAIEARHA